MPAARAADGKVVEVEELNKAPPPMNFSTFSLAARWRSRERFISIDIGQIARFSCEVEDGHF
jgi:hypothetical protein